MTLRPFFSYFGGKYRIAPKYPTPDYDVVIEPFAGSAGYSLRHFAKEVVLVEKNPVLVRLWDYLIHVSVDEVLSLPDLSPGQCARDLNVSAAAEDLIGFWLCKGATAPRQTPSAWMRDGRWANSFWGPAIRQRIANQVPHIRHWIVLEGDYRDSPDMPATWFVDPPYQTAGKHYVCGTKTLDFKNLGQWCRSLQGQVMVCESEGADWLPFDPFVTAKAMSGTHRTRVSHEALYYQETP